MKLAAAGAEHGTAVMASTQTMGRGRLGKSWLSPAGKGLYCSIILRPKICIPDFPRLTFVAGLAVAEAINGLYSLQPGLKWPNDIYFARRKCGGILTESSSLTRRDHECFAIVGIGLNVNTAKEDFPDELQGAATSLYLESGRLMEIDTLFLRVRDSLLLETLQFSQKGFGLVIGRWRQHDFLKGQRLSWVSVARERVEGISLGPDDDGRLHIRDDCGRVHEVLSGDIQLAHNLAGK